MLFVCGGGRTISESLPSAEADIPCLADSRRCRKLSGLTTLEEDGGFQDGEEEAEEEANAFTVGCSQMTLSLHHYEGKGSENSRLASSQSDMC